MLKNIYAPLSSGMIKEKEFDMIGNNLANANTNAFKQDFLSATAVMSNPWPNYKDPNPPAPIKIDQSGLYPLHGNDMAYAALSKVKTDHSLGPISETKRDLNVALQNPNSYFEISTNMGSRYSRDGSFDISPQGFLVTKSGDVVQGEQGPIPGFTGENIKILRSGEVYCGEKFLGKLKLVSFEQQEHLERVGHNLWVYNGLNMEKSQSEVYQGFLEKSNVNPVKNLVQMITVQREYEAARQNIKSQEETMKLGNKLPSLQS